MSLDSVVPPSAQPTAVPRRLRLSRSGRAVIVAGILTTGCVIVGVCLMLWQLRQSEIAEWKAHLSQTSITLAEHTRQTMTAADLVLKSIRDRVYDADISTEAELRREMGTREIFDLLRNRSSSVPQVGVATIVAANGDVINFTRSYPPPPINLSDRDYFKAHMADTNLEVFFSEPVQNRGTGTWTFYLARKITNRSGQTLGLVLAGIESDFFQNFFEAVNIGKESAISLFRNDGILLARFPMRDALIGTSFGNQAVFRDIISAGSQAGTVVTTSPRLADGHVTQMRIVAPRTIKDYPLVINITATEDLVLDLWYSLLSIIGGGTALFALLLLALTAWIATLLTRRERDMADLRHARREAEDAAQAKGEFLAMMSHEIRTPMNAVIGTSSLLADSRLQPEQRRYVRIIEDSAGQLLAIINDILDFSRLESGRFDVEKNVFDLRELAESAVEIARGLKGADRIAIATAIAGNIPALMVGDAGRLNQVLLNLLSNAVKYTERGAVTLSAAIVDQTETTTQVRFSVTDTGTGISPEVQTRLFQPFEQGDSRLARRKGGTGLGLAICKRIVDLMGGRVGLESQLGHGSTFWFEIKLDKAPADASLPAERPKLPRTIRRSLRVLVAEDTPANQVVARAILEKLGHRVQLVGDGDEAVRAAKAATFDLILMDVQMPTMDGYEATRLIRALAQPSARTPIVALTAFAQPADRDAAIAAGMTDYLSKPIRMSDLAAIIDRVVKPESVDLEERATLDEAALVELGESVGAEAFTRLIARFIQDAEASLADVEAHRADRDVARLHKAAHRLTGLFGQFGAPLAAAAAENVESSDGERSLSLVDELRLQGRAALDALRRRHPAKI